jgi:lon-related putative ATP-dependent protease
VSAAGTGPKPLGPDDLSPAIDLGRLDFQTTEQVEGVRSQLGEERAMSALRLGIRLRTEGYNVFVAGLEGPGRETQVKDLILGEAGDMPTPPDIVYLHNFDDPDRPLALKLKAGDGRKLRKDMERLISTLSRQIPEALKKESFEREKEQITSTYDRQIKELFNTFQESARERGVLFRMSSDGQMVFAPLKDDGEPVANQEEYENLTKERKKELSKNREAVQREARELVKQQQAISKKVREEVEETVRKFAAELVDPLVSAISSEHEDGDVGAYLQKVRDSILENLENFQQEEETPSPFPFPMLKMSQEDKFLPYQVNLIVDNAGKKGAPVVVQDSPTYQNLFGSIERVVDQTGKLVTNFTRIKAGDLLRANGGFLVFDLDDALTEMFVWKPLKRVLKNGRIEIESQNPFAFISVSGLNPEPICIDIRLVVTGSRYAYSILSSVDPEFRGIFKVLADFAPEEKRGEEAEWAYVRRVAHLVAEEKLRHFTRDGVAELLRFGVRRAGDQSRLSARLHEVEDLAREANLVTLEKGEEFVDASAVRDAVERRIFRANWMEERGRELFEDGTLLLRVEGREVGQINALTVIFFGGYTFGRPARLTASVSMGSAGIVNIEREAKLSGSIHDKGVLIIAGFLRNRFGRDKPLSFSASLCFEQSYSGVEGDSASAAELYVLLSRIADIPLRQDLAVTGSVNQRGEIQAVGGVNEKIEGFFRTCERIGLTGDQGVLIPASNVKHLVLHPQVVSAVREGRFSIYPVTTVEEGMGLLTGMPAGAPGEEGTIMDAVDKALLDMARALKKFGSPDKGEKEENGDED